MYMRKIAPISRTTSIRSHGRRPLAEPKTAFPPGAIDAGIGTSGIGADTAAAISRRSLMSPTTSSASSERVCRNSAISPSSRWMRSPRSVGSVSPDVAFVSSRMAGVLMAPLPSGRAAGSESAPLPGYSSRYPAISGPTSGAENAAGPADSWRARAEMPVGRLLDLFDERLQGAGPHLHGRRLVLRHAHLPGERVLDRLAALDGRLGNGGELGDPRQRQDAVALLAEMSDGQVFQRGEELL